MHKKRARRERALNSFVRKRKVAASPLHRETYDDGGGGERSFRIETCETLTELRLTSPRTDGKHLLRMFKVVVDSLGHFDYIGKMKTNTAVNALSALAQETRLERFRLWVRKGQKGMAAGELSSHFVMPAATMSFHLKELSSAGLIVPRRESRSIIYSANYDQMQQLMSFMLENCCAEESENNDDKDGGKCQ